MTIITRVQAAYRRLFGRPVQVAVAAPVDESAGWESFGAPGERPWGERLLDLEDALEAWRKNFLVRRIVTLTRSYVVAGGMSVGARDRLVDRFVRDFWEHPQNHMAGRLGTLCDELCRMGEVFIALFTNRVDGMSYVRLVPARQIVEVRTDPEDYERELAYVQQLPLGELRVWPSTHDAAAFRPAADGTLPPLMLHWAVNRPVGATRGESDLTPILPWARRYSEWLKDRVRLNRQRTRQGLMDLRVADDALVAQKRQQLRQDNPVEAGIYVHGPGEEVRYHALAIEADRAADDGRALRLAIAAGANVGLHYLGEGGEVNYATAKEMGEPSARFFAERQAELVRGIRELLEVAYRRKAALGLAPARRDLGISVTVAEVARADNESLARAFQAAVEALAQMRAHGWIDDETAVQLALRFAGEPIGPGQARRLLERAAGQTGAEERPAPYHEGGTQRWPH